MSIAQKISFSIRKLLFAKNMHVSQLAKETGIPQQTLSRLILAQTNRPQKKTIKQLAEYFQLSFDELINLGVKETCIKTLPILLANQIDEWLNSSSNIEIYDKVITDSNISSKSFAIKIADSSMEPVFPVGSIALFDPERTFYNNSYVLINLSNNAYVFRQLILTTESQFIRPLNPDLAKFLVQQISDKDKIIATLVEVQHKFIERA